MRPSGASGRIEIYDSLGIQAGGFAASETDRPASITAIRVLPNDILVADAAALLIRRFNLQGRSIGLIGNKSKTGKFILPNKSLDLAVDANNRVYATDTGRHQVTCWTLDGTPQGSFGKFGMIQPEDFVGCCNPVNIATTPEGKIVTAEKMVARVKVYEPDGRLLAVIGPENFDPACTHIYLAVDARGRIFAADPVRCEVKVFAPAGEEQSGAQA
jgi:sugar lactone lactonase YvrE